MKKWIDGHGWCEVWSLPKVSPKKQREGKYVQESFVHPAKMDVGLCRKIIGTYTEPSEVVLDPMAGISTTLIEAAYLGRNAVGVELEEKFVNTSKRNIGLLEGKKTLTPKGRAEIIQGDARELSKLMAEKVNTVVFSPPFERSLARENPNRKKGYWKGSGGYQSGRGTEGYGESEGNIGNFPHGKVDSIITSPPYQETMSTKRHDSPRTREISTDKKLHLYPRSEGNIGSKKGETYLRAMFRVYAECFKVLKPGGRMVLVLKDFIRNKRVVRLDLDTKRLCESAGFRWVETKLFKLPSKSFWRVLYERKYPEVDTSLLQYEFVEVFEKAGLKVYTHKVFKD